MTKPRCDHLPQSARNSSSKWRGGRLSKSRVENTLTVAIFALLLLAPLIALLLGVRPSEAREGKPIASAPPFSVGKTFDASYYAMVDVFILDNMPLRQESAAAINASIYAVTGESPVEAAFVSRDDIWFLREDFTIPCVEQSRPEELSSAVQKWEASSKGTTDFIVVVAPDKSTIINENVTARTRLARGCQMAQMEQLRAAFEGTDNLIDVWTPLTAAYTDWLADGEASDPLYFSNDSHWTFRGARVMVETVLESLNAGPFEPSNPLHQSERTLVGDITRRLGLERTETVPEHTVNRANVQTKRVVDTTPSRQGVRKYTSTAGVQPDLASDAAALVPGRTVILHDSMMKYAEAMLAPYFEHVEFIHWDDLYGGDFFGRVADADRVIIETVQRRISLSEQALLDPTFADRMTASVSP